MFLWGEEVFCDNNVAQTSPSDSGRSCLSLVLFSSSVMGSYTDRVSDTRLLCDISSKSLKTIKPSTHNFLEETCLRYGRCNSLGWSHSHYSVAPWTSVPTLRHHETIFYSPDKQLVTRYTLHLRRQRAKFLMLPRVALFILPALSAHRISSITAKICWWITIQESKRLKKEQMLTSICVSVLINVAVDTLPVLFKM